MIRIGQINLDPGAVLAPMAGVTDRPFRELCRRRGAAAAIAEMVTSDPRLYATRKTKWRLDRDGEIGPRWVQIMGADPARLAAAARFNARRGADIIDINLGCPARKVCGADAGSALLRHESLVAKILSRVVDAVNVPVTAKIRTGWNPANRNAVTIARIAEAAGIAALTVHGRTRACGFKSAAEYETVRRVVRAVDIPVLVNGDIDSADKAAAVVDYTGADAVMVGRAALGDPWLFTRIKARLENAPVVDRPAANGERDDILHHLRDLHSFYGEFTGVRIARKHLSWYCRGRPGGTAFWRAIRRVDNKRAQYELTAQYLAEQHSTGGIAA